MNNAGTVCQGNVAVTYHIMSFFMLFFCSICSTLIQRLVLLVFQIGSLVALQNLVGILSQNGITQSGSQVIYLSVLFHLNLYILLIRIHAESHVRRQSPRSCCPGQNAGILTLYPETGNCRTLFYILIALSHLVG